LWLFGGLDFDVDHFAGGNFGLGIEDALFVVDALAMRVRVDEHDI